MDYHFLPQDNLQKLSKTKIDPDVVKSMQGYAEKVITDLINRSSLLARHANKEIIDADELMIIVEKDFDYSFGNRSTMEEPNLPTDEHIEKTAEISRQR
jgi:hypothetical protein